MSQNLQFTERLAILTDPERKLIYDLPQFTLQERKFYFNLEKIEEDILREKLSGLNSKIYFILQLGYFKSSYRFFRFKFHEGLEDVKYILEKYFPQNTVHELNQICNKKARLNHCAIILKLFSYKFLIKEDKEAPF